MAKTDHILHLRIQQDGKTLHRFLRGDAAFFVGKSPKNDVTLIGTQFPKRHPLFVGKRNHFKMQLPMAVEGEIQARNSRLRLSDLIEHELLPRQRGSYVLDLKPGRMGTIFLDGTRIDFVYETRPLAQYRFAAFSPLRVFLRSLKQDALFKGVVTALLLLNAGVLYALRDYVPAPKKQVAIEQVTQRLARFVINEPEPVTPPASSVATTQGSAENKPAEPEPRKTEPKKTAEKEPSGEPRKTVDPSNLGVLALLGGTGESNASNSVVDFLLSKDLATGLDEVTRSKKLTLGRSGTRASDDQVDELLTTISTGGIDDILGDIGETVESVSLEKQGEVQIEQLGGITGSSEAVGARSEQSLYDVLRENMGRLTYIYNKYLKRNPNFRGEMRVEVTIAADGRVSHVKLLSSTMGNPDFEREILAAIRRFRYDPIARGTVTVVYPILFNRVQ